MIEKASIITGASSGLGKAMKDFLISETNHKVVSLSRTPEREDEYNKRIWYLTCDLVTIDSAEIIKKICDKYKKTEIIYINNAATIEPLKAVGSFEEGEISTYYKVNVMAPIRLINELVAHRQNGLIILNISSGAAQRAISHWALYCSAKAAVNMFCNVLAIDHPDVNVRNIDPGVLNTRMQTQIRDSYIPYLKAFVDMVEKEQLKEPFDAAREILASFV